MTHQCEARTTSRKRCRCEGAWYETVAYSDGMREYLVCTQHTRAVREGTFRPAVNKPVIAPVHHPVLRVAPTVPTEGGQVSG